MVDRCATRNVLDNVQCHSRESGHQHKLPYVMTSPVKVSLWSDASQQSWAAALDSYDDVLEKQGVNPLPDLDRWYRLELPVELAARNPPHGQLTELVRVTEWKMARGIWRARNLQLVKGNDAARVVAATTKAFGLAPKLGAPVQELALLDGVEPATASALLAAHRPDIYPFFDELVAAQIPELPEVKFTHRYYAVYADAIRERAQQLGASWTPVMVERSLWAFVGGKRGARPR